MDQIIPGLWIGDFRSAKDANNLRASNIQSVLTVMRGRISIPETFIHHQIPLDDVEEEDVLQHLIPAITFIQAQIDMDRGVLVHCQAGMSRSVAVAAAYLMYSQNIDTIAALDLIRKVRPNIERDKATRMFYLERAVEEILNGDGSFPETDMFAKFPRTPTDSAPATPGGPRRRIRCKMCRTELANREHMLDHGQLGPPTPVVAFSPASSRRPSTNDVAPRRPSSSSSRRPSGGALGISRPRLGSSSGPTRPSPLSPVEGSNGLSSLAVSSPVPTIDDDEERPMPNRDGVVHSEPTSDLACSPDFSTGISGSLSMSALDSDDDESVGSTTGPSASAPAPRTGGIPTANTAPPSPAPNQDTTGKSRPPPAHSAASTGAGTLQHGADLAAQLHANPKLAALRAPGGLSMTPLNTATRVMDKSSISPPILMNPKCSGYFVEPVSRQMKWMEFFLEDGKLAGKITCPNKKCGAKLGNYDWAGSRCNCKAWVVPGFCIHRSKVDEIV
ncbi:hypothetical protein F5148DRAFT_1276528 [Russula earlei]|uniref:Uncharacterized protein n=1 Tax=Russula earlei TaxID=71964 RepID=A0ACC0U4W6_9AGAM|nr:hypothetical protein F5148DRAFT_1276528 [Russula earlei]